MEITVPHTKMNSIDKNRQMLFNYPDFSMVEKQEGVIKTRCA